MHIHAGPHHCVCCRPFHFFVCVRLGALYVRLSLLFHNNTKQPAQQQTNVKIK